MVRKLRIKELIYDTQDEGYTYDNGDVFPRDGLKVNDDRLDEVHQKIDSEWLFADFTVQELKAHLTNNGVEFDPKAKREELLKLVGE